MDLLIPKFKLQLEFTRRSSKYRCQSIQVAVYDYFTAQYPALQ